MKRLTFSLLAFFLILFSSVSHASIVQAADVDNDSCANKEGIFTADNWQIVTNKTAHTITLTGLNTAFTAAKYYISVYSSEKDNWRDYASEWAPPVTNDASTKKITFTITDPTILDSTTDTSYVIYLNEKGALTNPILCKVGAFKATDPVAELCGTVSGSTCILSNNTTVDMLGGTISLCTDATKCCQSEAACIAAAPASLTCGLMTTNNADTCSCASGTQTIMTGSKYCCGWVANGTCYATAAEADSATQQTLKCGETTTDNTRKCGCTSTFEKIGDSNTYCCGFATDGQCKAEPIENNSGTGGGNGATKPQRLDPFAGPNAANFRALNPLVMLNSSAQNELSTPGGIISRILLFSFPIAGLILFAMLVWAGFEIVLGSAGGKSIDAGRQRATAAIIGFGLLFVSYWLMQIVEVIFGVTIL